MKRLSNIASRPSRIIAIIIAVLILGPSAGNTQAVQLTTFDSPIGSQSALTPRAWLPAVMNKHPWIKIKGGIHLGNRPGDNNDWNTPTDYLTRLKGTPQGPWPAAVVVLSNQVYNITRSGAGCETISVAVKNPYIFDYLKQAAQRGTKIVIRIYPSPGNFTDSVQPQPLNPSSHAVIATPGVKPVSASYCDILTRRRRDGSVVMTARADELFRDVRDIAREMKAIHDYNLTFASTIADQEFFMPANEPNTEWYAAWYNEDARPKQDNALAWSDMNAYFRNLYDTAKGLNQSIRILTPTMAQLNYAERIVFASCNQNVLFVPDIGPTPAAGYDYMEETYRYKNDGIAWHNYWFQAKEFWSDNFCGNPANQTSHHVAQYFPVYLSDEIAAGIKPTFILEADLYSPCQLGGNPIQGKDDFSGDATAESLWRFVQQERATKYTAAWLLTERPHFAGGCVPAGEPSEIAWHEAYRDFGAERPWFPKWWTRDE